MEDSFDVVQDELLDYQRIIKKAKGGKSGKMSISAQDYEQITIKEIINRVKQRQPDEVAKPTGPLVLPKYAKPAKTGPMALFDITETTHNYRIEMPRSGILCRQEFIQPLYLPYTSEEDQQISAAVEQSTEASNEQIQQKSGKIRKNAKLQRVIIELVYCSDWSFNASKDSDLVMRPKKKHFGLSFESNFESGNLFKVSNTL